MAEKSLDLTNLHDLPYSEAYDKILEWLNNTHSKEIQITFKDNPNLNFAEILGLSHDEPIPGSWKESPYLDTDSAIIFMADSTGTLVIAQRDWINPEIQKITS